jgi:hypothetical protein
MRKPVILLLCILSVSGAWAQKKQSKDKYSLQEIFLDGGFAAKGVYGM